MESAQNLPKQSAVPLAELLEYFLSEEDLRYLNRVSFPAVHRIKASRTGMHRARLRGGTAEFAEHRAYAPGDEVRRLDWRILGRSERLEIKVYEDPSTLDNVLLLDGSASMGFAGATQSKFLYGCSVATFLAKVLLAQRDPVGMMIAAQDAPAFLPPKSSTQHFAQILTTLRNASFQMGDRLNEQIRHLAKTLRNPSRVMIITDAIVDLPAFEEELGMLVSRGHRFHLLHTLAPEEVNFSYEQPLKFQSMECSSRVSANPQEIREGYLVALKRHVEALRRICLNCQAGYEPLVTDRPVGQALSEFIRRQSERKR